jgi:hypothetical protein
MCRRRRIALVTASLLAVAVLVGCGDSEDAGTDGGSGDGADAETVSPETDEPGDEIAVEADPSDEREFGIAADPRAEELVEAAREQFGDRWAGASFDIPDDVPPTMTIHVVGATDADRDWVRGRTSEIEPAWAELVDLVAVERSLEDLRDLLEVVLERVTDLGEALPIQLDVAGNRLVIDGPSLPADQRDQIRSDLAPGSVAFADEIVDEDEDGDAAGNSAGD